MVRSSWRKLKTPEEKAARTFAAREAKLNKLYARKYEELPEYVRRSFSRPEGVALLRAGKLRLRDYPK